MKRGLLGLFLAFMFIGCNRSGPTTNLPTTPMTIGSKTYTLEIAAKNDDRDHGLMQRDSMPSDHGMIFVFGKDTEEPFWMENTRIPLDILYVRQDGRVTTIKHMLPYHRESITSDGPYRYAIELNAGEAESSGVKNGDTLKIPDVVRSTRADP